MHPTLVSFQPFLEQLRGAFPEIQGTDAQLAALIADALDVLDPEHPGACADARILWTEFLTIAAAAGGDTDYPNDDDDD